MKRGIDYISVAVVTFLHDGNGKYLVGLRSKKSSDEQSRWDALGPGGLEHGETLKEGILREVEEEAGVVPFNIEYLGFREVLREIDGKTSHWISFDFKAQVNPQEVSLDDTDMFTNIRWCTPTEIPEPLHSQGHIFLEKYKNKL